MEKRIGTALILVEDTASIPQLNTILSTQADMIIGRQGLPLNDRNIRVITIVFEGNTDRIGELTGRIGRLKGIKIRSVLAK
jgi:putative iron-only hydrogenase system regulator